jgi:hypothetical protein
MSNRIPRIRGNHHTGRSLPVNEPQDGLYKKKIRGVWVPGIIWSEQPRHPDTGEVLDRAVKQLCVVDGQHMDPRDAWPMHELELDEYLRLCDEREDQLKKEMWNDPRR